jgi:hypothetical protein
VGILASCFLHKVALNLKISKKIGSLLASMFLQINGVEVRRYFVTMAKKLQKFGEHFQIC